MNREQAKELLPIIQAYVDGKVIQCIQGGEWIDMIGNYEPAFYDGCQYRIKPEKIVRYVNIYTKTAYTETVETREIADNTAKNADRIACVRIEFEEGQFDD